MTAIGAVGIGTSQSTVARKLIPASRRVIPANRKRVCGLATIGARWFVMLCILSVLAGIEGCKRKVPVTAADEGAIPQIGGRALDFTLPTSNGESVSLDQFLGKSKVVLVFYRGYW